MTAVSMNLKVGERLYFRGEKRPYRVRAVGSRFAVCTKPMNARRTVIYTIVDMIERIRGTENLIFCAGFESDEDCQEAIIRLESGDTKISRRNRVDVDLVEWRAA